MAERRSVAADVVGSKPTSRPKFFLQETSSVASLFQILPPAPLPPEPSANLHIGTSGWAYPSWKPDFYPPKTSAKKFLEHYASRLTSVEVNYTFRTLPTLPQLEGWLAATPAHFRFSFKAPQRITHFARLLDCSAHVADFLAAIEPVRAAGKLGILLFQLPPNFKADPSTHARLAALLRIPALATHRLAFEFRHASWFADATYGLLRDQNAALCIAESDDLATPEVHTAATHTAFRLRRNGGYTQSELTAIAARLTGLAEGRDVYAYLKHEDEPTGALNAVALLAAAAATPAKAVAAPPASPVNARKRR